jgi:hypothetical protein
MSSPAPQPENVRVSKRTLEKLIPRRSSIGSVSVNGDLDEAAGAADATACLRDGYFLSYKICVLSDNRLRCAVPTFLDDLASGTPEAIKRRNDHSIPIHKDMTGPPPKQTPAASSKSPYRECPGGKHSGPRGRSAPAHLSIGH